MCNFGETWFKMVINEMQLTKKIELGEFMKLLSNFENLVKRWLWHELYI